MMNGDPGDQPNDPDDLWRVGDVVAGLYHVREVITWGGMGVVYRMWHPRWNVEQAVKTPRLSLVASPARLRNFEAEAESWVRLGVHPNIVSCVYVRRIAGVPHVFADWVDGGSLHQAIESRRLYDGTSDEVLARIFDVAIQMAWGLEHAHRCGLIHQDMKPSNVMLGGDGVAKVTDFGLARARAIAGTTDASPETTLSAPFARGLTPAYCSPEQAAAADPDSTPGSRVAAVVSRATDVWSWAITVWGMFAGRRPINHGSIAAERFVDYLADPTGWEPVAVNMPHGVAELLTRCLQRDLAVRPRDLGDLADDLAVLYEQSIGVPYARPKPTEAALLADGLSNQALSMLDIGRVETAEELWRQAVAVDPRHLHSIYNLGLHRWRSGQITDAELVDDLEAARTSHPGDPACDFRLSWVHRERGDQRLATLHRLDGSHKIDIGEGNWESDLYELIETDVPAGTHTPLCMPRKLRAAHRSADGQYTCLALSTDGGTVVAAMHDIADVWDAATGQYRGNLVGHRGTIRSVALSADGRIAITGSDDQTMRIWDTTTRLCLHEVLGGDGSVDAVAVTGDGQRAVSGTSTGTIQIWVTETGTCVGQLTEQTPLLQRDIPSRHPAPALAVSSDGRRGIVAGNRAQGPMSTALAFAPHLFDIATTRRIGRLETHTDAVRFVSLSTDGSLALTVSSLGALRLWNTQQARPKWSHEPRGTDFGAALSADGRLVATVCASAGLQIWQTDTQRCLYTLSTDAFMAVALSGSGSVAATLGPDSVLVWMDLPTESGPAAPWSYAQPTSHAELAGEAATIQQAIVAADKFLAGRSLRRAATELRTARARRGYRRHPQLVDRWRNLGRHGQRTTLCDAWPRRTVSTRPNWAHRVAALSPDGRLVLPLSSQVLRIEQTGGHHLLRECSVEVWDISTGQPLTFLEAAEDYGNLACSADGRRIVTAATHLTPSGIVGRIRGWDAVGGRCLWTQWVARPSDSSELQIGEVAISPDGRLAVATFLRDADVGDRVAVWDMDSGSCVRELDGFECITAAVVSAEGHVVLGGAVDRSLAVWDVSTGRCTYQLPDHRFDTNAVAVSADGRRVVFDEYEGLRIWYPDLGCSVLAVHTLDATDMTSWAVDADAEVAVTGGYDGVQIWDLVTGNSIRELPVRSGPLSVAISADAQLIAVDHGAENGDIEVWALDWEYNFDDEATE
jgi:WD40 repeat protein/serine/threonine protein kinase